MKLAAQPGCATVPGHSSSPRAPWSVRLCARAVPLALAAMLVAGAAPAQAQIRKLVEADGKIVFVNADDNNPVKRPRGTISNSNTALAAAARAEQAEYVDEMAKKHNVDPALIRAVIAAESGYNPSATSRKGAQGLMQLMPGTAQQLGVHDAYNAKQNLDAGVRYLRALLDKYNGDLDKALAAYNAGEGAVERAGGVPNIRETRDYVRRITDNYYHSDSSGTRRWIPTPRQIRREVTADGKVVFTNE